MGCWGRSGDVVVLQMANPDVTDQTLEHLRGSTALKDLDLNNTQVTDAGLKVLKDLPALSDVAAEEHEGHRPGFRELAGGEGVAEAARPDRDPGQPRDGPGLAEGQARSAGDALRDDRFQARSTRTSAMFAALDETTPGDPRNALFLAQACGLAYLTRPRPARGFARIWGWSEADQRRQHPGVRRPERQGDGRGLSRLSVARPPGRAQGLAADQRQQLPDPARGPDRHRLRRRGGRRPVPSRFHGALDEIWEPLFAAVDEAMESSERPLWVTGHSLGGPGAAGGLAAPAELPPGARDRHLRRRR